MNMKLSSFENNLIQAPSLQWARLSGSHGYRFDGDTVHLNAMFALLNPAAHDCSWSLQLWACTSEPASGKDLVGHIVAEVALPPMGELADESEHFEVSALAWPPAGVAEHVMVLVLASGRPGQAQEVQDFAVYARRQSFIQPRIVGNVGYRIEGERVQMTVDRVENPRFEDNRSGTLSLELWALPEAFGGRRFQGHYLAGVEFGPVAGQSGLDLQPINVAFTPPPTGNWQIVLMLREWTAAGFVTRDFTNFATRFVSAPIAEKAATPPVIKAPLPEVVKQSAPKAEKAVSPPALKVLPPAKPARGSSGASDKGVSINTAPAEELAAVKGLSAKLAQGIVRKRPFASLDELGEVKGIGAKILAKVRSRLRL
jgi:competence ComEA-like helix-hairpin-helix protein